MHCGQSRSGANRGSAVETCCPDDLEECSYTDMTNIKIRAKDVIEHWLTLYNRLKGSSYRIAELARQGLLKKERRRDLRR